MSTTCAKYLTDEEERGDPFRRKDVAFSARKESRNTLHLCVEPQKRVVVRID